MRTQGQLSGCQEWQDRNLSAELSSIKEETKKKSDKQRNVSTKTTRTGLGAGLSWFLLSQWPGVQPSCIDPNMVIIRAADLSAPARWCFFSQHHLGNTCDRGPSGPHEPAGQLIQHNGGPRK